MYALIYINTLMMCADAHEYPHTHAIGVIEFCSVAGERLALASFVRADIGKRTNIVRRRAIADANQLDIHNSTRSFGTMLLALSMQTLSIRACDRVQAHVIQVKVPTVTNMVLTVG